MSENAIKRSGGFGRFFRKRTDIDMTVGSIPGNLIRFAIPLFLGALFQQLYNMVDTWVIGQTGDNAAYAAVGNMGPITNILVGFFMGLSTGASVVIAQYYGAKDNEKVSKSVHTSVMLTLVLSAVFTVVGLVSAPLILKLMLHVGPDSADSGVYPAAKTYLMIYFGGIAAQLIYNMSAGILRAIGDSDRPFYFLIVSAVTNVILDLLFVYKGGMGVAGVALATVISQIVTAVLSVYVLLTTPSCVRVNLRKIAIDGDCMKKILKIGLPTGIQTALTSFSNVFVQSYISGTDGAASIAMLPRETVQEINMSAWTTYSKIDNILFLPMTSMSMALTTFVGQNLGVGNVERAKKSVRIGWAIITVAVIACMVPLFIFTRGIASFFKNDPNVLDAAVMLLKTLTPFYLFCCVNQTLLGTMRGAGNSTAPMIIMLSCFVGARQLYLFVMTTFISNALLPVGLSYPFGWFCCASAMFVYYKFFFDFTKHRVTGDKEKRR
ncbi:MAG: MATE family efflux transporter [Clostridia bacterium]|nr:MATE family efflux transporter [Clostridia bacterium]